MKRKTIAIGDTAPDFSLPDQNGDEVSLGQFRGSKNVVLYFYPRDNTPGCTAQACAFRDRCESFDAVDTVILGISSDSIGAHGAFASRHDLPFHILSDEGGKVRKLYAVPGFTILGLPGRVTYVIDRNGKVIHIYKSMLKPGSHVKEALAALERASTRHSST